MIGTSFCKVVIVMKQNTPFLRGMTDGIPIGLGYLAVSFAFGIFAMEQGLDPWQAVLISMTCVTSAGQLAAVPIIAGGGSLVTLALSQLVINMRYALMSISLTQKFGPDIRFGDRFWIAFGNTDEIFAMASGQKSSVSKGYMAGLILVPWAGWACGTAVGALAGNILPPIVTSALGVAIYGMFLAIVVPEARKDKAVAGCVAIAVALSCLIAWCPLLEFLQTFSVILCAVAASAVMAWLAPIEEVEE
jgi:4-azaleucine resistance transporter AzlC